MNRRGRMSGGRGAAATAGGGGVTIGAAVTGGTATRVPYWGAGPVIAESALLTFTVGSGLLSASILKATGLTAGRIPIVSTGGQIADDAELLYDSTTNVLTAGSLKATGLTAGRLPIVSTAGLIADDAELLYDATTNILTTGGLVASLATVPVTATITDAGAATQIEAARLRHLASVTATAGISVYQSYWTSNGVAGGATLKEAARTHGMLRAVADGAEQGVFLVQTNQSGTVANGAWVNGTQLYAGSILAIGSISATGVSTPLWNASIASTMATYTSSAAAQGGHSFVGTANTSGRRSFWVDTPSANTAITTTTERITRAYGTAHTNGVPDLATITQTWANGTVALQRENVWVAPTYLQTSGTNVMTMTCHHDFGSIPTITGTTNSQTGARVARFGGSAAQGVTAATTTYVGAEFVPSTITFTGGTQVTSPVGASQMRLDILTLTDNTAVTFDRCATLDIVGPVAGTGAGPVTITDALSVYVRTGTSKFNDRVVMGAPNSAIADAKLDASQCSFYLNEVGNLLTVKVKYADGTTVKTGTIALV